MKSYSEITKTDFNCYVTPASNLEVGDVINWIGIYDAGKEVYFDTISLLKKERLILFKVIDIDYNPNKPDDIIFEFDKVLINFEDTGVYSLPLCCFFAEKKQDYWMIPAIEIKRSKGISRGKTDKSDSKEIAFYALTHMHKLRLSILPEKDLMKL